MVQSVLQAGSSGSDVSRLQRQLQTDGYYSGPIDGNYGPDTQAAVVAFQQAQGLSADGVAGPATLAALFETSAPSPTAVVSAPTVGASLEYNCLSLTGAFETGQKPPNCFAVIAGDFDGQGMSFGALQWNFGQGTLQPMLQQMDRQHSDLVDELFGNDAAPLRQALGQPQDQQMAWIRSIQTGDKIQQPWHDQFMALGLSDEFQQIELAYAQQRFNAAASWCPTYGVSSQRAVALMFDINVQNGSISNATQQLILQDFAGLQPTGDPSQDEVNKLVIIANRRADAVSTQYQADVRARKLCIATGQGTVHGAAYDVANDFGITLATAL